jgi:phosphoribosylanthranilate isomerase
VLRAYEALALDLVQIVSDEPGWRPAALPLAQLWVVRGTPAQIDLPTVPLPRRVLLDAAVPGYGGAGRRPTGRGPARDPGSCRPRLPVWLAGGITPENAGDALAAVDPAGLDVASGAELPGARRGEKDRARIAGCERCS